MGTRETVRAPAPRTSRARRVLTTPPVVPTPPATRKLAPGLFTATLVAADVLGLQARQAELETRRIAVSGAIKVAESRLAELLSLTPDQVLRPVPGLSVRDSGFSTPDEAVAAASESERAFWSRTIEKGDQRGRAPRVRLTVGEASLELPVWIVPVN